MPSYNFRLKIIELGGNTLNRGSEWHRWEPHIHAPGTVLADQYPAGSWSQYLDALEAVTPALRAIGITDYCVTQSYERPSGERKGPAEELRIVIS
ncbi:hypothetical protein KUL72_30095 [Bradyrhizobium arachidis]|uniref:hypothetical protein n=1 Tax=Bradyrhizobium arachidis TaxID=858423 RepID=UPI00216322C0|nr:hypothetical protein [Bradyrhizobium arachidis]UVO35640.1 hypothetical protein KUL72_30095 [Bradyrhizobium arachidis]